MFSRFLFLAVTSCALASVLLPARAQDLPANVPGNAAPLPDARLASVLSVDSTNLAALPNLLGRAGAVSLGVFADDLDKNSVARDALLGWVRGGGTVFLHTDAARIFGYRTVAAREGTARQAGQLYGRGRAAVPFGAMPLLWDDGQNAVAGARLPGINTVFYTLRAGDDLVVDHPAGTPLLEVTDLAAPNPTNRPLYAAAIAPFGAGWAVFTPDAIDTRRAEGAAFSRNLLKLVAGPNGSRYIGVSQAAIASGQGLLQALSNALTGGRAASLPALGADNVGDLPVAREGTLTGVPVATNGAATNGAAPNNLAPNGIIAPNGANVPLNTSVAAGPVLLLTRGEATAFGGALQNDPTVRGAAALAILRARVALLNGDYRAADAQISLAERVAPAAGEIPFLRGITAVGNVGTSTGLTSLQRAQAANLAANSFAAASRARPFFAAINPNGNAGAVEYGDVSGANLDALGAQINRLSQILSLEPPLSRVVGNGASAITIRYFEGDTALPFVERGAAALANSNVFGWSVAGQEILLFPTPAIYANYRAAAGLSEQNVPLPAAAVGDVIDGRILMVSIPPARPVTVLPNGQVRVLPLRATSAALLARFESYALVDAYLGVGGGRIPSWMALGLESLADLTVNGDTVSAGFNDELTRFAVAGGLLAPNQFSGQLGDSSDLARAQATALMRYFYANFGAGRVAETIQRLGAGETVDEALTNTTGFNEINFFRAWRNAQFGKLNLPN